MRGPGEQQREGVIVAAQRSVGSGLRRPPGPAATHAQLAALSFAVMKLRYKVVEYNAYCRMIDRSVCTGAARSVFICVRTSTQALVGRRDSHQAVHLRRAADVVIRNAPLLNVNRYLCPARLTLCEPLAFPACRPRSGSADATSGSGRLQRSR